MRSSDSQLGVVPLQSGMDQSAGTRGAAPGTLYRVKNCRIDAGGLVLRAGTSAIPGTTIGSIHSISSTASLTNPTGEHPSFIGYAGGQRLAGTTSGKMFAYSDDASRWAFQGRISGAQPVGMRNGMMPSQPSESFGALSYPATAATSDGYLCYAAPTNAETLHAVVENPSGEVIYRLAVSVTGIVETRVVVVGSVFYVVYRNGSNLIAYSLTVASGAVTAAGPTTLSVSGSGNFDASSYDGTNWFIVARQSTTATIAKMSGTTVADSATWPVTSDASLSVWADPVAAQVWVGFVETSGSVATHSYARYDVATVTQQDTAALLSVDSGGTPPTGSPPLFGPLYIASPGTSAFYILCQEVAEWPATRSTMLTYVGSIRDTTPSTSRRLQNLVPVSKPDAQHRVWCYTWADDGSEAVSVTRAVMLRFTDPEGAHEVTPTVVELASSLMLNLYGSAHPQAHIATHFHAVASTGTGATDKAFFPWLEAVSVNTNDGGTYEQRVAARVCEYSRGIGDPHRALVTAAGIAVVSGQPTQAVGRPGAQTAAASGSTEVGFAQRPVILAATSSASGTGVESGTYTYRAVWEWTDSQGRRHLSPPSDPVSVTLAVQSNVALDVTVPSVGGRIDLAATDIDERAPRVLLYRTVDAGVVHHAVPVEQVAPTSASDGGYATLTDGTSNTSVAENEILYTEGAVLANTLAPSCRYLASAEDRLWAGGLFERNIVEASKRFTPAEPINFTGHPTHQVVLPEDCTGLAYLDGQVLAFAESAIYAFGGEGPNNQGQGEFQPARAIAVGIGCPESESASILVTELGVIFRSKLGFYLIPRGVGTPQYIGGAVEAEDAHVLSAAVTVTSEQRLARFLVAGAGESKGDTVLAFDLVSTQWLADEYTVNGTTTGQGFSEIGAWPDGLALFSYGLEQADNLQIVWAEAEGLTADAGAAGAGAATTISQSITTTWQFPFGQGGWGSLRQGIVVFEAVGNDSVTLQIETDANAAISGTFAVTAGDALFSRGKQVVDQKSNAWRATISTAGGAAGIRFLAVVVEAHPQTGLRPFDSGERT